MLERKIKISIQNKMKYIWRHHEKSKYAINSNIIPSIWVVNNLSYTCVNNKFINE